MTLIILAIAWLLGILAADLFSLPLLPLSIVAATSVPIAMAGRRVPRARLAALALGCAALGAARYDLAQVPITPRSIQLLNDQGDLLLQGVVVDDPKRAEDGQRAMIAVMRIIAGKSRQMVPQTAVLGSSAIVFNRKSCGHSLNQMSPVK